MKQGCQFLSLLTFLISILSFCVFSPNSAAFLQLFIQNDRSTSGSQSQTGRPVGQHQLLCPTQSWSMFNSISAWVSDWHHSAQYELRLLRILPARASFPAPAVVISLVDIPISLSAIHNKFTRFEAVDDVFSKSLTSGGYLIIQHSVNPSTEKLPDDVIEYLSASSTELLTLDEQVPEGPYFVFQQSLHQAWRLYPDVLSAFARIVIPKDEDSSANAFKSAQKCGNLPVM